MKLTTLEAERIIRKRLRRTATARDLIDLMLTDGDMTEEGATLDEADICTQARRGYRLAVLFRAIAEIRMTRPRLPEDERFWISEEPLGPQAPPGCGWALVDERQGGEIAYFTSERQAQFVLWLVTLGIELQNDAVAHGDLT